MRTQTATIIIADEVIRDVPGMDGLAIQQLAADYTSLFEAVENMMAVLGADGQITTRSELVLKVMDEMHRGDPK